MKEIKEVSIWLTAKDGSKQFMRAWSVPNQAVKSVLLYLHGIEGHSNWFAGTATFLAENGIPVFALDRRGSGMSQSQRGDLRSHKLLYSDLDQAMDCIKEQYPSEALILMANCWGAKLAVSYLRRSLSSKKKNNSDNLKGIIFSSPAISAKIDMSISNKLLIIWRCLTFNLMPLAIPLKPEDFTDNPAFLEYIRNDPLRLIEATARFYFNSWWLTKLALNDCKRIDIPVLIMQAGIDSIVDINSVQEWFNCLQCTDKELIVFQDMNHSLDFALETEAYRKKLLAWISMKTEAPKLKVGFN